ncbi:MAG: hypothetical protein CK429_35075 [Mycobacterium sp.]|uniref:LysR family transcriptional regulator n=1 Tax=Mycobacterium sp. TaxID=1785 RepID=UPI000CBD0E2F|nr:LysR family transcriptional regulator [Mycobacterium sp.]PJE01095.1 MAG: hypothetical protein CK428_31675 [Mycobacterium sp.]PJE02105.1 MAG: hypothetical protein CK429_35075 [Mycobacterium sp.]PJE21756.1 MAG: hypothetical protein CK431_20140 [Mycobacterium sp.]
MDVQRLRHFLAVAKELHFTRAAQHLHIDQGTLSASIRRLERDLNLVLFERNSRRVQLTPAGEGLLDDVYQLVQRADLLMQTVRRHQVAATSELVVGLFFGPCAAGELTEPILVTFRHRHPNIKLKTVTLDLTNQHTAISSGKCEVALVRLPWSAPDVAITPILEEPRVAVVPNTHDLHDVTTLRPAELGVLQQATLPFIATQPREFQDFYLLGDQWDLADISRRAIGPGNNDIRKFLAQDNRALITAMSWQRIHAPDLHAITLKDLPGSQVGVATPTGHLTQPVSAFVQCARDVARQLAGLMPSAHALV